MSGPVAAPASGRAVAGWYGKIPALGDFASRRLPSDFVEAWDSWLQRGMAASKCALREQWQLIYLNSPIWRFVLLPDIFGQSAWTGIMMPSVDSVGRHFPLVIATQVDSPSLAAVRDAQGWFAAIEQIALSTLSLEFRLDDLEDRLSITPFAVDAPGNAIEAAAAVELADWWTKPSGRAIGLDLPGIDSVPVVLAAGALGAMAKAGTGRSLWWCRDEFSGTSTIHGFCGMPPDQYFSIMLSGPAEPVTQRPDAAATEST